MNAIKNVFRGEHDSDKNAPGTGTVGNHEYETGTGSGLRQGSTGTGLNSGTGVTGNSGTGVSGTGGAGRTDNPPTGPGTRGLSGSEVDGPGRSGAASGTFSGGREHTTGHDHSSAARFDPNSELTTHDHKHLNHVTHRDVRHVEVEEVEQQKDIEKHIHHIQHHVQPVLDKQVADEVIHENAVPVTTIQEKHVNTAEDRQLFSGLANQYQDTESHRNKERTVVDLGETVTENVHHHVHHVTQPVIEQEVIERERIHTVIPVQQVTHEAPIIHKSSTHEPVTMDNFLSGGGKLGSGITPDRAGVLNEGECERSVDGVGETLAQELHLRGTSHSGHSHGSTGLSSNARDSGIAGNQSGYTGDNTQGSGVTGDNLGQGRTGLGESGNAALNSRGDI